MDQPTEANLYQILGDGVPGSTALIASPAQVWVIATLEISVSCLDGVYLISQLSSYALRNQRLSAEHHEGYLAPPFVAYPAPIQYAPPSTLGSLRELCQAAASDQIVERDMQQLAYRLGLRDVALERRLSFVEIKVSPRSPEHVKAFAFLRYGLTRVSDDSIPNLADREGLLGFVYLPLEGHGIRHGIERFSALHQRNEKWFAGKPVQSNLEHVLTESTMEAQVAASAFSVPIDEFSSRDRGLVIACDLSRYGSALKLARSDMGGYLGTGDDAAESFSQSVSHTLQNFISSLGTMQVQLAGDGIIASLPDRLGDSIGARVERVLSAWAIVVASINVLNTRAPRGLSVGSRLAIHYGDYRFGRIAGPESVVVGFDGPGIVESARLEAAMAQLVDNNAEDKQHAVVFSDSVPYRPSDETLGKHSMKMLGRHDLSVKEYAATVDVYSLG